MLLNCLLFGVTRQPVQRKSIAGLVGKVHLVAVGIEGMREHDCGIDCGQEGWKKNWCSDKHFDRMTTALRESFSSSLSLNDDDDGKRSHRIETSVEWG